MDGIVYESILRTALERTAGRFDNKGNRNVRFEISANGRNLILDSCGASVDRYDALSFLMTLAGEYLRISRKEKFEYTRTVLDPGTEPSGIELQQTDSRMPSGRRGRLCCSRKSIPLFDLLETAEKNGTDIRKVLDEAVLTSSTCCEKPECSYLCVSDIPEEIVQHITSVDYILGNVSRSAYACAFAIYSDNVYLNISRRKDMRRSKLPDSDFCGFDCLEVLVAVQA